MRILKFTILVTVAAMAGAGAASAQGMYAGGNLGINYTHDGEIASSGFDTAFAVGYAIGGYVGFDMGDYRLEGEVSYRANDIDDIAGVPWPGDVKTTALMANAFYDFDSGLPFVPYVGVGLGVGFSTINYGGSLDGDATAIAYQIILGGSYGMTDTLDLTLDYRFFSMGTPKYDFSGIEISQAYSNSAFMFGVRTSF